MKLPQIFCNLTFRPDCVQRQGYGS